MHQPDRLKQFLETVKKQIRWKRAHPVLLAEIEDHIQDQKNAFMQTGSDEETALNQSIADMGDPVTVGEALDRIHRPKPDWKLLALTGVILLAGIIFQLLIEPNPWNIGLFGKQLIWVGIGIIAMLGAYFIDFTVIGRYPKVIYFSLGLLIIISFFVGGTVNGAHRYSIYPLLFYPIAYAGFLHSMRGKGYSGVVLSGVAFIVPALLAFYVPSIATLILLCFSCLILLVTAISNGLFNVNKVFALLLVFFSSAAATFLLFYVMVLSKGDYALARLMAFILPARDSNGAGYIGTLIQNLLSHSKLIGEGFPINDMQPSLSDLPGTNTDFVLVYLIYRYGWITLIGILAVFSAFFIRSAKLSRKQPSALGALVSRAALLTICMELLLYVISNMGILLHSPISLPLISYGGGTLVVNMLMIGFLLSVFRTGGLVKDGAEHKTFIRTRFIQYEEGRIIINLKNKAAKSSHS